MFDGIFGLFYFIIEELTRHTVFLISDIFYVNQINGIDLYDFDFNLTLFSDIPIISTDLNTLLVGFFTIFYSMFFIVLLYKVTKKIIKKVFGVFRV